MTTTQVVETSVTVDNNSPIQDYVNPDDQTQPTFEMTPGFKPFTVSLLSWSVMIKTSLMNVHHFINITAGLAQVEFKFKLIYSHLFNYNTTTIRKKKKRNQL